MSSDEYYYSSDSYSDMKPDLSRSAKKPMAAPFKSPNQKLPVQVNRRPIVNKRPLPGCSTPQNSTPQNSTKLPAKKFSPTSVLRPSPSQIKVQAPIDSDSDSGSYYDYVSESDSLSDYGNLPLPNTASQMKQTIDLASNKSNKCISKQANQSQSNKQVPTQSSQKVSSKRINKQSPKASPPKQANSKNKINLDKNIALQAEQNNESSSSDVCEFYENEVGFCDTNEEPQIKISEQTLNLMRPKSFQSTAKRQTCDENIDIDNISEASLITDIGNKENLIYRVTRTKSQLSHYTFQFFSRDQCLMSAFSSNTRKSVDFKVQELFEQDDILIGSMSVSKNRRKFNLSSNGKEVMSASVSTVKKPIFYDRFFTVNLKSPDTNKRDVVLRTMMPKVRPDGKLSMNFRGKFAKKSIKNMILINNAEEKAIIVRRIGESELEIEVSPLINDNLKIFAFGVMSWICPH